MASIYADPFLKDLPDSFFDDFDIDTLPQDLVQDLNIEQLLFASDELSENNNLSLVEVGNNSTLESLLKSLPHSGCVPPAPQIPVENNRIIESHNTNIKVFKCNPDKDHPQLKQALVQDKPLRQLYDDPFDIVDGSQYCPTILLDSSFHKKPLITICSDTNSQNIQSKDYDQTMLENKYFVESENGNLVNQNESINDSKSARRSPHNAIERRYRQSINGKIDELRDILNASSGDDLKTNKSAVLRRTIDRIRYLEKENECLRMELKMTRNGYSCSEDKDNENFNKRHEIVRMSMKPMRPRAIRPSITHVKTDLLESVQSDHNIHCHHPPAPASNSSPSLQFSKWNNNHDSGGSFGDYQAMLSSSSSEMMGSPPSEMSSSLSGADGGPSTASVASFSPSDSLGNGSMTSPEYYSCYQIGKRPANGQLLPYQGPTPTKSALYCFSENDGYQYHYPPPNHPQQPGQPQMMTVYMTDEEANNNNIIQPETSSGYFYSSTNIPTTNPVSAVYNSSITTNGGTFTKASLFLGSFCLFMFNPFILNPNTTGSNGGADVSGMPVRQMLSALSLNLQRDDDSSSGYNTISPFLLSLMYAAQWVVALLLLWVAQPINLSILRTTVLGQRNGCVDQFSGGSLALRHYRQATEDLRHAKWTSASGQLKAALASIRATPCLPEDDGNCVGLIPWALAWTQVYVHGLKLLLIRLPYFIYLLSRRFRMEKNEEKKRSTVARSPTVAQLRRHLLDLRFLDLVQLSNNKPAPSDAVEMSSYECLHVLRLMFACLEDWVSGWSEFCKGSSSSSLDAAEMTRLGVVLGLSVKRFFGLHWIGNLVFRGTQHMSEMTTSEESLWLGPLDGSAMKLLLESQPPEFPGSYRSCSIGYNENENTRIFTSPLSIREKQCAMRTSLTSDSLVVNEVHSELCEALMAKALEHLIVRKLGADSPFDSYIEALRRLSCLDWINYDRTQQSPLFDLGDESSENDDDVSEISLPSSIYSDFEKNEGECPYSARTSWWLNLLELAGKWYTANPPLSMTFGKRGGPLKTTRKPIDVLPGAPFALLHSPNSAIVRLTSLAYNALAVTQSDEFADESTTSQKKQEKIVLAVWIALRQACDLLDDLSKPSQVPSLNPQGKLTESPLVKRNTLVFAAFQLMAQDWMCHAFVSLSQKRQTLLTTDAASKTLDCLRRSLDSKAIAIAFAGVLRHQKQVVHRLNACPAVWTAHLNAIQRRLCGANPLRTRLFLLQGMGDSSEEALCTQVLLTKSPSTDVFGICGLPVNTTCLLRTAELAPVELSPQQSPVLSSRVIPNLKPCPNRRSLTSPDTHYLSN